MTFLYQSPLNLVEIAWSAKWGFFWSSGVGFHPVTELKSFFPPQSLFHVQSILFSLLFFFLPFPRAFIHLATIWGAPDDIKDTVLRSERIEGWVRDYSSSTAATGELLNIADVSLLHLLLCQDRVVLQTLATLEPPQAALKKRLWGSGQYGPSFGVGKVLLKTSFPENVGTTLSYGDTLNR